MRESDKTIIANQISPKVGSGEISLLLGAGFSINNSNGEATIPGAESLKHELLKKCERQAGQKTSLKDAYQLASRTLENFNEVFSKFFTTNSAAPWQQKIFQYAWSRIYTTNIDNVLNVAESETRRQGKSAGEFKFFNYTDEGLISETIGIIPVITIHGTCSRLDDGFIFSTLEYAKAAAKILDWHNDLAARMIAGGVVIIGNQLDESDFDTYISRRSQTYGQNIQSQNWIVLPNPDPIKSENWTAAGFTVIDSTAEEFFAVLYETCKPKNIGEILIEKVPTAKKATIDVKAATWFRGSFQLAFDEIEKAKHQTGLLKHFITGSHPDWFYIVNKAHANLQKGQELLNKAASLLQKNSTGVGIIHVIGPSGSGKTTAIRSTLETLVHTYKFTYEFNETQTIDKQLFRLIVDRLTEKSIFIFYSAAEYYFTIKEISDRHKDKVNPYCLFILEDRTSDHQKNRRQLSNPGITPEYVELGNLSHADAKAIAQKIEDAGHTFPRFSEKDLNARAGIILDKEKGFGGDLLSALFSLTNHENFETKIYQDYQSAENPLAKSILNTTSILHALNYNTPLDYIAGSLDEKTDNVVEKVNEDLAGILVIPQGTDIVRCRHRVIANYYFNNHIKGMGSISAIYGILNFLSRKFTVEDIKYHPLPYRIYRDIVSFEFLYEKYFPAQTRDSDTEKLYHECQKLYGRDGIFWLHFGRYYRKVGRPHEAVECFRTGLDFYESFQTKHSLGMTLLEIYISEGDIKTFQEGISYLDSERQKRGSSDPYPTATMLQLLTKVLVKRPENLEAGVLAKTCWNFGIKHFRDDEFFTNVSTDYLRVTRRL